MQKIWQQPFPSPLNISNSLRMSFISGICVFCVLYFIQPFGIKQLAGNHAAIIGMQYAAVTVLFSLFCNTGIPFLFPGFFADVRWTVLHEIIFLTILILIVALGNILFTALQYKTHITGDFVFKMLQYTLTIGIIPVVISVLIKQQQLLMKYSKGARAMETLITKKNIIQQPAVKPEAAQLVSTIEQPYQIKITARQIIVLQLTGTNQQEALTVAQQDFLFAEASDNYTAIHYLEKDIPQKVLYRVTIKNLEAQTITADSIFRCHKSYLVNLSQVSNITGNAQGYKLHLMQNKFEIPVSRSLNSRIKDEFVALKKVK
jgi:DNA-binding LytR/AlgR family response regulator